jgi:hypothetical protein
VVLLWEGSLMVELFGLKEQARYALPSFCSEINWLQKRGFLEGNSFCIAIVGRDLVPPLRWSAFLGLWGGSANQNR